MEQIKKIHFIGKCFKIPAQILSILSFILFCFMLISSIVFLITINDTITITTNFNSTVLLDNNNGTNLLHKIVSSALFKSEFYNDNLNLSLSDDLNMSFNDSKILIDGTLYDANVPISIIAKFGLCFSFKFLLLSIVFFFVYKFGKSLIETDGPFALSCIKSLKMTAFSILALVIGTTILDCIYQQILTSISHLSFSFDFNLEFTALIISLIFIALTYIFEYCAQIYHNIQDGIF